MDTRRRYLAPAAEPFAALMQERTLVGFIVEPMPPMEVRDRYLDTDEGVLLEQNLMFRLREHGGVATASLRSVEGEEEVAHVRFKPPASTDTVQLPEGTLREIVEARTGGRPLGILLHLRQYRTARALYDDDRLVAVLSLDVVADVNESGEEVITNEVEVELVEGGGPEDLLRIDRELQERAFASDSFSKFERGLLRRSRADAAPLFLLPRERAVLERLRGSESAVERRRAEVILLAAERHGTREISRAVSLSPSRVRHWRHAFRQQRLRVFDDEAPDAAPVAAPEPLRAFHVTEVLSYAPSDPPPLEGDQGAQDSGSEDAGAPEDGTATEDILGEVLRLVAEHAAPPSSEGRADDEFADLPTDPPVLAPVGSASPRAEDGPDEDERPGGGAPDPDATERPGSDWPIAKAAAQELEAAAQALAQADTALAEEDSLEAVQKGEKALGRLRLALGFFDAVLSDEEAGRIGRVGAKAEAALAEARALHRAQQALDRAQRALEAAPDTDAERLTWALAQTVWGGERRRRLAALAESEALLELSEHVRAAAGRLRQEEGDSPGRLRHVLASSLWQRYERLRAYEGVLGRGGADVSAVRPLLADLVYLLGFAGSGEGHRVAAALERVVEALNEHFAAGELASRIQRVTEEWIRPGGAADPEPLVRLQGDALAAAEAASQRFVPLWEVLVSPRFREALGRISAAV